MSFRGLDVSVPQPNFAYQTTCTSESHNPKPRRGEELETQKIRSPLVDISPTQPEKEERLLAPAQCAQSTSAQCAPPTLHANISNVISKLSSFLLKEDGKSLTLEGLSEVDFDQADEEARAQTSEFLKWEGMRVDFSSNTGVLIVEWPTAAHEVADQAFCGVIWGSSEYWPVNLGNEITDKPPHLKHRGQVTLPLVNGKKSADFSLADSSPGLPDIFVAFPTVVWEVAYTQTSRELAETCARWIACSLGRILLAIRIDIVGEKVEVKRQVKKHQKVEKQSRKKPENQKSADQTVIKHVDCFLWELVHSEKVPTVPEGDRLNVLVRCDGQEEDPERLVPVPIGTRYYCISGLLEGRKTGPPFIKYVAGVTKTFQVIPEDPDGDPYSKNIEILHRHAYRHPADEAKEKPLFTLPCSSLALAVREGLEAHRQLQATTLKCTWEEEQKDSELLIEAASRAFPKPKINT